LARRADRVKKLKEARTQATKEIEDYRKFKEEEFKAFEASVRRPACTRVLARSCMSATQHAGNTQSAQAAIDKETEVKKAEIAEQYARNKEAVVKKLLDRVTLITPELHRNLRKREE
jgi:V-type H+-transporting ATPase subunit G